MITRIVKLSFDPDRIDDFLAHFERIKNDVNNFPGCIGMKLYHDVANQNVVFTYSHWNTEADLEAYRKSDLFSKIWPTIKVWFNDRPEAWTVEAHFDGFEAKQ
jgi:heme-degrading monooxygenase HmoA